jgi:uncharacterized protein with von Willebrand factor type A (vWA) domain
MNEKPIKQETMIKARPKKTTQKLSLGERSLGEMVKLDLSELPESESMGDLAGDIFFHLFKTHPEPLPEDEVNSGRKINSRLLEWMKGLPNFEDSRRSTSGSLTSSRCAAPLMWESLRTEEALQEALKKQEEIDQKEQEQKSEQALSDAHSGMGDEGTAKDHQERADQLGEQIEQLQKQANDSLEGLEENRIMAAKMNSSMKKAKEEADEQVEAMMGWGIDPEDPEFHNPDIALEFARMNTERLQFIAKLAGRVKGIGTQARRNRVSVGVVPTDVKRTKKIDHLLPSEMVKISGWMPEGIRFPALVEFCQNGLLGWELTGDAKESGPFVLMLDRSGSMSVSRGGSRQSLDIGLGIALGLAGIAEDQGREFILASFSSEYYPILHCSSRDGWKKRMEWASQSAAGGTSFDYALEWAMEKLIEIEGDKFGTDTVFITDGECMVSDENYSMWKTFNEETGSRLLYIPVDESGREVNPQVKELADRTVVLNDLAEDTADLMAQEIAPWMR